jgi:hypothetical protein
MATFKDIEHVTRSAAPAYDLERKPGTITPFSGVYRCFVCGKEIVSEYNKPLPPQSHHVHQPSAGPIRWKLLVFAQHKGS